MVDLNGHELETADTANENLQPIGTPLLGERRCFANSASKVVPTSVLNLIVWNVTQVAYSFRGQTPVRSR
jgi:hypothetical protein